MQSLKDTSKWAGFTYENEDGNIVGQGKLDMQMYQDMHAGGGSLNHDSKIDVDNGDNFWIQYHLIAYIKYDWKHNSNDLSHTLYI